MMTKRNIRCTFVGLFQLVLATSLWSQEEIKIDYEAKRTVPEAYRQEENPRIIDTVFPVPKVNFPLLAMNYEPTLEVKPIEPATVNMVPKLPQLYSGYVKVGIGSIVMPLGELYYNNTRTRKLNWGGHVKHLSSFGALKGYAPANFDRTTIRGFGGVNDKKYDWAADASYTNNGFHYYGFRNEKANADSIAQRFHTTQISGKYVSHKHDSLGINWKIGAAFRNTSLKKPFYDSLSEWKARENNVAITGGAWFRWGGELFEVDAEIRHNAYAYGIADSARTLLDTGIVSNNTIVSLQPHVTTYSKNEKLKATFGADITLSAGQKTNLYLYPNINVKYALFNDILIPYLGLRGGLTQLTLQGLADVNPFVLTQVNLSNESKSLEGYGGVKGTLSRRVSFNVFAAFGHIKNKAFFVTDTLLSKGNQFRLVYDTLNQAQVEGSVSYQFLEKTKLDFIGRFYSYTLRNNSFAWNLPQTQFVLRGTRNLYDKFLFHVDFLLETGRKAQVYSKAAGVIEENGQFAQSIGAIVDANLGVEYRYNKRVSAFLQFNNFAAQRYQRWLNYPVMGFQVMGGITARF